MHAYFWPIHGCFQIDRLVIFTVAIISRKSIEFSFFSTKWENTWNFKSLRDIITPFYSYINHQWTRTTTSIITIAKKRLIFMHKESKRPTLSFAFYILHVNILKKLLRLFTYFDRHNFRKEYISEEPQWQIIKLLK